MSTKFEYKHKLDDFKFWLGVIYKVPVEWGKSVTLPKQVFQVAGVRLLSISDLLLLSIALTSQSTLPLIPLLQTEYNQFCVNIQSDMINYKENLVNSKHPE